MGEGLLSFMRLLIGSVLDTLHANAKKWKLYLAKGLIY